MKLGQLSPNAVIIGGCSAFALYLLWKWTGGGEEKPNGGGVVDFMAESLNEKAKELSNLGENFAFSPIWWANRIGGAYSDVPESVDTAEKPNIIYRGANGAGAMITGDEKFTVGGWLYDLTHPTGK